MYFFIRKLKPTYKTYFEDRHIIEKYAARYFVAENAIQPSQNIIFAVKLWVCLSYQNFSSKHASCFPEIDPMELGEKWSVFNFLALIEESERQCLHYKHCIRFSYYPICDRRSNWTDAYVLEFYESGDYAFSSGFSLIFWIHSFTRFLSAIHLLFHFAL